MNGDRIALIAATLPLFVYGAGSDYEQPNPLHLAVLLGACACFAAVVLKKRWAGTLTLGVLIVLAVYLRTTLTENRASDVMLSTNEAISVLFHGLNPYAHAYAMTNPPGSPFGYPPGEIVLYALAQILGGNVFRVDISCSIFTIGLLAALTPLVGDGIVAVGISVIGFAPDILFHLSDGSNDNTAAFLVLAGVVALAWSLASRGRSATIFWWTSAVLLGWALAFKEYALPIGVFIALYLWRRDAPRARGWIAVLAGTTAVFVLPFLAWNPAGFVQNVGGALLVHSNVWGRNFWHDFVALTPGAERIARIIPSVLLLAIAGLGGALWRRPAPSLGPALLQGMAIVATMFLLARWTTSVYWMFFIPLLCGAAALTFPTEERALD